MKNRFLYCFMEVMAIIILLLCPTVYFIKLNQYPLFHPETILLLAVVILLGIVFGLIINFSNWAVRTVLVSFLMIFTLSFFPEFHNSFFMTAGFLVCLILAMALNRYILGVVMVSATVLLCSIGLFSVGTIQTEPVLKDFPVATKSKKLKPVIHLLLDEHIGIDGIPMEINGAKELKKSLTQFYIKNGFHLYTRAYSHYSRSYNAVPNILNYFPRSLDNIYFQGSKLHNVLKENAYFRNLSDMGYNLRVYQSSYIDFCQLSDINYQSCYTYPATSIKYLASLPLGADQKFFYMSRSILLTSYLYEGLLKGFEDQLRQVAKHFNYQLGHWPWYHAHTSTIGALQVFPEILTDIAEGANGTAFFAHLIIPHSPYIFDEACHVNPKVSEWELHTYIGDEINTAKSRQNRYEHYLPQVQCVEKSLGLFFSTLKKMGIYNQASIVVHSDHGSRIMINGPFAGNQDILTKQDFNDGFSTLFAIKSPEYKPGISKKQLAADYLLARFVERITGTRLPLKERESYIFLSPKEAKSQQLMVEVPLDTLS